MWSFSTLMLYFVQCDFCTKRSIQFFFDFFEGEPLGFKCLYLFNTFQGVGGIHLVAGGGYFGDIDEALFRPVADGGICYLGLFCELSDFE